MYNALVPNPVVPLLALKAELGVELGWAKWLKGEVVDEVGCWKMLVGTVDGVVVEAKEEKGRLTLLGLGYIGGR